MTQRVEPTAGTIFGFVLEVVVRVVLFALVYAFGAVLALFAVWIMTRFVHFILYFTSWSNPALNELTGYIFLGMVFLAAVSGALVGAVAAIGSVLIRSFSGMLALSVIAALVPVIYFVALGPFSMQTIFYYLGGGAAAGLFGLLVAWVSGLLRSDRRLIQDFWR